ncbi:MAG: glycosyltransferase family 4 protein [Acidobacteriota bacterium]
MRILWVATKAPWPPIDGGRLVLYETLRALRAAGHRLTLVAPLAADPVRREEVTASLRPICRTEWVDAAPRPLVLDLLRSQVQRRPLTIVRHALPAMRRRVDELLQSEHYDVVQAEQVQALDAAEIAASHGVPVVLRAQNVESDLWSQTARQAGWLGWPLGWEARRLAAWEGGAVGRCPATVALTGEDAERLTELAGGPVVASDWSASRVRPIAAPFEAELPHADRALPGTPSVVLFGSRGWRPNTGGTAWFVEAIWPHVRKALPDAVLHVFGEAPAARGVVRHLPPSDSRTAYPPGAVLVVPLQVASGVRIKILEAWARGVPVLATPQAARGLAAEDGRHLLLAQDGPGFATALQRFVAEPSLAATLVEAGRQRLLDHHAPARVAERLSALYEEL